MNLQQRVTDAFKSQFGGSPEFIVRAPGRVNLIGEHTDYNQGFALPMAIDRAIWIAGRRRTDSRVWLRSLDIGQPVEFSLDQPAHRGDWSEYVQGMAWALNAECYPLSGWEGVLASDVPVGSGLSSSAAIELAVARAFWGITQWDWDGVRIARAAQRHENEWMGLQSGVMDQLISAVGCEGYAFLIDFLDLSYQPCAVPEDVVIIVLDTKVKRGLVTSAYNERVAECATAAAYFGVSSLREVTPDMVRTESGELDERILRRARHVVLENERVKAAVAQWSVADNSGFGRLMLQSHTSLRDDYEVSCGELDLMVALSAAQPECYGARMTGAGFGGCAVALVEASAADRFCAKVAEGYEAAVQIRPEVYVCRPANGAEWFSV